MGQACFSLALCREGKMQGENNVLSFLVILSLEVLSWHKIVCKLLGGGVIKGTWAKY